MEILWQALFQIAVVKMQNLLTDASFNVLEKLDELWILDPDFFFFFFLQLKSPSFGITWIYMSWHFFRESVWLVVFPSGID